MTQMLRRSGFIGVNLRNLRIAKHFAVLCRSMSEAPLPMREHALDNIRFIRDAMERAGSFTSIPGWGGVAVGVTAIGAAVIAQQFLGKSLRMWLATWLAEAIVAAAIGFGTMTVKARRSEEPFMSGAAKRFFISYFAPLVAGAVVTLALVRVEAYAAIPSVWLLLYGAAFVSSGAFSIRVIPLMGILFMLFGGLAAFVPLNASNILLGIAFGGLHILFGFIIARSYGG
jgi:hypothetical protein